MSENDRERPSDGETGGDDREILPSQLPSEEYDTPWGLPTVEDGPEYDIDFEKHPELYRVDRGETGVFKVEPYKSELLPVWGFADAETAREAATEIRGKFAQYRETGDFVGMDMARKYLQMGFTRAMRYAKYPGGKKYDDGTQRDPQEWADPDKREAAVIFREQLDQVRDTEQYQKLRDHHRSRFE